MSLVRVPGRIQHFIVYRPGVSCPWSHNPYLRQERETPQTPVTRERRVKRGKTSVRREKRTIGKDWDVVLISRGHTRGMTLKGITRDQVYSPPGPTQIEYRPWTSQYRSKPRQPTPTTLSRPRGGDPRHSLRPDYLNRTVCC